MILPAVGTWITMQSLGGLTQQSKSIWDDPQLYELAKDPAYQERARGWGVKMDIPKIAAGQPDTLRGVESAGLTSAALHEMEAARSIMERQSAYDIQRLRPQFGGTGAFRSGARTRAEMGIREAYAGRLADALAGIALESEQARRGEGVAERQMAMQQRQIENQQISNILSVALPFILNKTMGQDTTPEISQNPNLAMMQFGLDPNVGEGWTRRPATVEDHIKFELEENPIY